MNKRKKPAPDEMQSINGETGHKYYHMMLNMADDDLNPHEYRLLGHYLRWAGHGGTREEGIRTTAKVCHMGQVALRKARASLVAKGYLIVKEPTKAQAEDGVPTKITVVDRWAENIARYAKDETPVSEQIQGVPKQIQVSAKEPVSKQIHPPVSEQIHKEEPIEEELGNNDSASYADWMAFLNKEFKIGTSSPNAAHLFNMFRGRSQKGEYKENNILPAATLEEVRQWVVYEKRQQLEQHGKAEFIIRKAATINSKFTYWREKRAAVETEKIINAEFERLTA